MNHRENAQLLLETRRAISLAIAKLSMIQQGAANTPGAQTYEVREALEWIGRRKEELNEMRRDDLSDGHCILRALTDEEVPA